MLSRQQLTQADSKFVPHVYHTWINNSLIPAWKQHKFTNKCFVKWLERCASEICLVHNRGKSSVFTVVRCHQKETCRKAILSTKQRATPFFSYTFNTKIPAKSSVGVPHRAEWKVWGVGPHQLCAIYRDEGTAYFSITTFANHCIYMPCFISLYRFWYDKLCN